jgi:nicotinate-nucleotide pyrophosphorylase (carboxylating)
MLFLFIEVKMRLDDLILQAIEEDLGNGDITTNYLDLARTNTVAYMVAKTEGMVAGVDVAIRVFKLLDSELKTTVYRKDGDMVKPFDEILRIEGNPSSILKAERTALNFIQRLSGIATKTHNLTKLIEQTGVKLLDTRKTTPLLRRLEKYAVRVGGGYNHRSGLYDMILIKENHIRAAGGIAEAISRVKLHNTTYKIDVRTIKQAVKKFKNKVELEVSGGINESNIQLYASTGVDYISCGALTHSVKAMDISLLFKE